MATMIDNDHLLARYNQWMSERLYQACDGLSDAVNHGLASLAAALASA